MHNDKLTLSLEGELTLYTLPKTIEKLKDISLYKKVIIDLNNITYLDSGACIYLLDLRDKNNNIEIFIPPSSNSSKLLDLVENQRKKYTREYKEISKNLLEDFGKKIYFLLVELVAYVTFLGKIFTYKFREFFDLKNIRYKEIAFNVNESAIKAVGIVAITSFLIGLVIAYQAAYQLKTYGANIFIVDMVGLSVLRELSPVITAIVVAGRSASSYTAQIGAMKITQELDAMDTMGFDPIRFLVIPRIIALMITLPLLIFVSDIVAIIGGMVVANINLNISTTLFVDRFYDAIEVKHFIIGIAKGPFFAFLIATIGIYRGMAVKDDTQSIGFNTTKSVVEAIFAVIICDAIFSILFTKLGL